MRFYLIVVLLLISPSLYGDFQQFEALKEKGELRIALNGKDIIPFFYTDKNGTLKGIEIDLANEICKQLGVKPIFNRSTKSFEGLADLIASDEADICVSYLSITPRRARKVLFSRPYMRFKATLLVNSMTATRNGWNAKEASFFDYLKKNKGEGISILTEKGGWYAQLSRVEFPKAKIIEVSDWEKHISDVFAGKISCVFYDNFVLGDILRKHPELNTRLFLEEHKEIEDLIGIAVSPELSQLVPWLNSFIELNRHKFLVENPEKLFQINESIEQENRTQNEAFEQQNVNADSRNKAMTAVMISCFILFLAIFLRVKYVAGKISFCPEKKEDKK